MMVGIDLEGFPKFSSCLEFTQGLTKEQSVQTFPGFPCFFFPVRKAKILMKVSLIFLLVFRLTSVLC